MVNGILRESGASWQEGKFAILNLDELCERENCVLYRTAINLYFVYNINISLKYVFEIHGANLPHYHCQLTPLVGHLSGKALDYDSKGLMFESHGY
ncbi:hypothetical protein OUZ56_011754 [Daphnia magna]|uniref:Uncharacterized protein n=1 Tax=Daphnia magna TaxID=35525 RepID=A0ABQ9Z126_9CRUS|nr:hypothetical protein OUZ56_011754 [Daphnia magna]